LAIGGVTVDELMDRLSFREFTDWQAFASSEPFLPQRVDLMGALVASTIANVNRGKGRRAYSITDFMLIEKRVAEADAPTAEAADNHLQRVIIGLGGKIK
jgi:hypothetical protein